MSGIKFTPGSLYITPGASEAFKVSGDDVTGYLIRHISGDWGDVDEHDRRENELSLEHGWRILSCYLTSNAWERMSGHCPLSAYSDKLRASHTAR